MLLNVFEQPQNTFMQILKQWDLRCSNKDTEANDYTRDDYKFSEMIGQKLLIAILAPYLIRHSYIALER